MNVNRGGIKRSWRPFTQTLLGLLLGGFFLYFVFRDTDGAIILSTLRQANLAWLALLIPILLINYILRSTRWWMMLPVETLLSKRVAFDAFMIGSLGNCVLPGRLGDVLRGAVLGRKSPNTGIPGALASIILEKVLDGLIVLILLGFILIAAPFPEWLIKAGIVGASIFFILLLALLSVSVASSNQLWMRFASSSVTFSKLRLLIKKISIGLHGIQGIRIFILLMVISLIIWIVEIAFVFISFSMFGIELPIIAALVTVVFLSLALMLPAAPGFVGTYQFFVVSALTLFQVNESSALALGIGLNFLIIITTILLGVVALLLEGGISGVFKSKQSSS